MGLIILIKLIIWLIKTPIIIIIKSIINNKKINACQYYKRIVSTILFDNNKKKIRMR
jgi:hypothetical protein